MAVIHEDLVSSTTNTELPVYGSAQLGVYSATDDKYRYLITDHLGNVRTTIGGTKVSGDVELLAMQDYYPFGSEMPGRSITMSTFYKLGYQSQPVDEETGHNAFELRLYDARIGGWLSPDPYKQHFSPYMAMSNNPLSFIDPDGGMDGEGLGLFDNGQIGRDGRLALQFTTNAFDQFQEMCPTCNSMDIFDLYVSMRKNGVVAPSLMADINDGLELIGEKTVNAFVFDEFKGSTTYRYYRTSRRNRLSVSSFESFAAQEQGGVVSNENTYWAAGLALSGVLLADDATGVGVADDIAIPFILTGAFILDRLNNAGGFGNPEDWRETQPDPTQFPYRPSPSGPTGGGNGNWTDWLIGGSVAGGTLYFYEKFKEDQKSKLQPQLPTLVPKDNTNVKLPIIRKPIPAEAR